MKITIYELIRLVKEGKAPKKIGYLGYLYEYDEKQEDYEAFWIDHYDYLLDGINIFSQFENEV